MQFVGREQELNALKKAWEQTKLGSVQSIVIVGESRLGKTRIIQEFYAWLNREHDPENYWPDTLLGENDSLHVNPIFNHDNNNTGNISPPWLWWGLRWTKPDQRNTGQVSRCTVLADATLLDPHLEKIRQYLKYKKANKNAFVEASKTLVNIASGGILDPILSIYDRIEDWRRIRSSKTEKLTIQQQLDNKNESQLTELQSLIHGLTSTNIFSKEGLPLILILDDVHWADIESLQFIQRLLRHYCRHIPSKKNHPSRVLLIATTWEKEWNQNVAAPLTATAYSQPQTYSEVLRSIEDEVMNPQYIAPVFTECRLKKIDESLEVLVAKQFPGLTTSQTKLVADRAGGSPGMLIEILIKLRRNTHYFVKSDLLSTLTKSGENKIGKMDVGYKDLVEERLSEISADEANALKVASYLGISYSRAFVQQLITAIFQTLQNSLSERELQTILQRVDCPLALVQATSGHVDEFRLPIYQEVLRQQLEDHEDLWESVLQHETAVICDWLSEEKLASFTEDERALFLNFANQELSARLNQENIPELQLPLLKTVSTQLYDLEVSGRVVPMVPFLRQWIQVWKNCEISALLELPLQQLEAVIRCAQMLEKHNEVQAITNACVTLADSLTPSKQQSQLLIVGLQYLGDNLLINDQLKPAQALFERYLQEAENALVQFGITAERLLDVSLAQCLVGDILLKQDQVDEALRLNQAALATRERILYDFGETAQRLRDVSASQCLVGDILLQQDQVDEALRLNQAALATRKRILNDLGGTAQRLRDVYASQLSVSDILCQQDQVDEALRLNQASLAISEHILNDFGETAERLRDVSVSQCLVGDILLQQNQVDEALRLKQAALATRERILNDFGETAQRLRDVSISQHRVGDILLQQNQVDEALRLHQASLAISEQILNDFGETAQRLRDVSISQNRVGDILLQQNQVDEALRLNLAALAIFEQILNDFGETAERLRDVSVTHGRVGDILFKRDQVDKALRHYQASLAISERILKNFGETDQTLHDVSVTCSRLVVSLMSMNQDRSMVLLYAHKGIKAAQQLQEKESMYDVEAFIAWFKKVIGESNCG